MTRSSPLAFGAALVATLFTRSAEAQVRHAQPPAGVPPSRDTPADRQADHLREGAVQLAFGKGYRPGPALGVHVTDFEIRGSSQAVPWGSASTDYAQLKRRCSDDQARSVPGCIRIDAIEIFTHIDSTSQKVTLGVIPHTFIGSTETPFLEVDAGSEVTSDAGIIARRYGGQVVTAIPWPTPRPTPPSP
jgi:hypothetical protein